MGTLKNLGRKQRKLRTIYPQPHIALLAERSESGDWYVRNADHLSACVFFYYILFLIDAADFKNILFPLMYI
jgi:hypothetical protein